MSDLNNEKPPVFQSWKTWYTIVLGALVIQVIIYFIITHTFA